MKIDGEIVELRAWDAVRVRPVRGEATRPGRRALGSSLSARPISATLRARTSRAGATCGPTSGRPRSPRVATCQGLSLDRRPGSAGESNENEPRVHDSSDEHCLPQCAEMSLERAGYSSACCARRCSPSPTAWASFSHRANSSSSSDSATTLNWCTTRRFVYEPERRMRGSSTRR
jgi:hypothetical protein